MTSAGGWWVTLRPPTLEKKKKLGSFMSQGPNLQPSMFRVPKTLSAKLIIQYVSYAECFRSKYSIRAMGEFTENILFSMDKMFNIIANILKIFCYVVSILQLTKCSIFNTMFYGN